MATKSLVKRTRKPRDSFKRIEKLATHITAEEFLHRHVYCISPGDIQNWLKVQPVDAYIPRNLSPVCNFPEDGRCFHAHPTPEQLEEINNKLSPKPPELPVAKTIVIRRKRGAKKPPESKKYYCLLCEDWHSDNGDHRDAFIPHEQYKRKRGKPKKK